MLALMEPAEVADVEGVLVSLGLLTLVVAALWSSRGSNRRRLLELVAGSATFLAAGIALLATAGSLWFSEVGNFPPCELCWYQRIAMYPLVVVLGLAALRNSATARLSGLVIAGLGLAVSAWHNIIETWPSVDSGSCDVTNPCTLRWVEGLGFWTIPRLAAACFVLIIALTATDHIALRGTEET